jgi:hypothetical protein
MTLSEISAHKEVSRRMGKMTSSQESQRKMLRQIISKTFQQGEELQSRKFLKKISLKTKVAAIYLMDCLLFRSKDQDKIQK